MYCQSSGLSKLGVLYYKAELEHTCFMWRVVSDNSCGSVQILCHRLPYSCYHVNHVGAIGEPISVEQSVSTDIQSKDMIH